MSRRNKTIMDVQQEFAENCGYKTDVIWDLLSANESARMKIKIKQLIPDQEKGQSQIKELRDTIFKNVWKQRKYTNGLSMTSIFYVMVTKENVSPLHSTQYSCHPVFRCKKCDDNSNTTNCCMIYIDEVGRIYQNWDSYIKENVLPAGTMVTPRKGIYNFSCDKVILNCYCTPSGTDEAKVMNALQSGSAVAGIGASVVPIVGLLTPVAAPLVAAAGIVGLAVGAFTFLTSVSNLNDRDKHGQSISLGNRQARACYLGVAGGAVGVAAAGATRVMTSMAAAGKATAGIEVLVNGMNISSIVLSGSGVANGVLDIILKCNDGDTISRMDILQLSTSLVLFTHSVYNFQLASQIANNARVNSIKSYRETLSNRQRKMFDKMSKETIRIRGDTQGKMDIIRGVNEIPDRQYLNDLFKVNKQLNQRKVRPTFGKSGKGIVLNDELPVKTDALRQSVQHQQGPNILDQVSNPIPPKHSDVQTPKGAELSYLTVNNESILCNLEKMSADDVIMFFKFSLKVKQNIEDITKFADILLSMKANFPDNIIKYVQDLLQDFIENIRDEIMKEVKIYISTESVLYRILEHITQKYRDRSFEYISKKGEEIKKAVKEYFLSFNCKDEYATKIYCQTCRGVICISQL